MSRRKHLLGSILLHRGFVTEIQLKEALQKQMLYGKPLGSILIELGYLTRKDMTKIFSETVQKDDSLIYELTINQEVIDLINKDLILRYDICPVQKKMGRILLAVADLMDMENKDELNFVLNFNIDFVLVPLEVLRRAQRNYYGISFEKKSDDSSKKHSLDKLNQDVDKNTNEKSVVELIDGVLSNAIKNFANDIHFEATKEGINVRCRIEGVLVDIMKLSYSMSPSVISRIKVLSDLNITETRLPQDGRIDYFIEEHGFVQLRVSTLPTIYGESIVIRVLVKNEKMSVLNKLGLDEDSEKKLHNALLLSGGLILVTGPTGSGKTTTLYSMLKHLNQNNLKIMTVEDPIEYEIEGVIQSSVREKIGLSFVKSLRHLLRQDLDVLMIGEIRDKETVSIAVRSALTGHLILSSLHTNDTVGSIVRLLDMGIEPFLITSTVRVILAQRLLKMLCSYCKEEDPLSMNFLDKLGIVGHSGFSKKKKCFRPKGCERCQFTGYYGRTGIFEILIMTDTLKELVLKRATEKEIAFQAKAEGMVPLRESGLKKIFDGLTSVQDVLDQTLNIFA